MKSMNEQELKEKILTEEEKKILKVLKEFWNWDNNPFNSNGNYEITLEEQINNLISFCRKWSEAFQNLNNYGSEHEYPNLGKVINLSPMLRNLEAVFVTVKRKLEIKDYTDQELANELAKRIKNFSLDPIYLLYPLVVAGSQYLDWYNAEKKKLLETKLSSDQKQSTE